MSRSQRANVLGVEVDRLTMEESLRLAKSLIFRGGTHQHVVVNAAKIVAAHDDHSLKKTINDCSIVNVDGQAVVWASWLLRDPLPVRVAGIDFMDKLVEMSVAEGFSIYLLGAKEEVVRAVSNSFESRGARVVGYHDGYWRRDGLDDQDLVQDIASKRPNILLVALPSPLKEEFLATNLEALNANLCVGVGGSFDVVAGVTRRAPMAWQRLGLEWLYRLAQEPRRMFKRYMIGNSRFIWMVVAAAARKSRGREAQ